LRSAVATSSSRPETAVQRMFDRIALGEPIHLDALGRDELAAVLTVYEWLNGIVPGLPDKTAVQRTLARFDWFAPMRRLIDTGFVDRETELEQVDRYIGLPIEKPATDRETKPPIADKPTTGLDVTAYSPGASPPLFVFGPGGVGKSTVLAQ